MGKKRFDYALMLFEYLKRNEGVFTNIRVAAKELDLPHAYLEKVAQGLKKGGILEGRRGAGGGYRLAGKSENVSVETLINFYEPIRSFCPLLRKSEIRSTK